MSDFNEISNFVWGAADLIRDKFKRGDYEEVILPFLVLRRLDCVLEPTNDEVREQYEQYKDELNEDALQEVLKEAAEAPFYNYSEYTLETLLDEPNDIERNLKEYMHSFSPEMQDVLDNFGFEGTIEELDKHDLLYKVVKRFCQPEVDLHPDRVDNSTMGDIFEELIRKFNESLDENPGEHFTPREVVDLMAELAIEPDREDFEENQIMHVYDPCCGSGGMLTETEDRILQANEDVEVWMFGQEVNPQTYAICKSDMFIKGEEERAADNIADGSTLSKDAFPDKQFDYMLANPPYGKDWKSDKDAVKNEAEQGYGGRFGAGLPSTDDGQLLFLQNMLSKRQEPEDGGSRIAFISNASPLFTSDPNVSESKNECSIRRWILENDWLEALIRMPDELFYNTKISTYIWVLSNDKPAEREGEVQLIDASGEEFWNLMSENKGDKRKELTEDQIQDILDLYRANEESENSQIHDISEFGYRKVRIERPLRKNFKASKERIEQIKEERAFQNLSDNEEGEKKQEAIIEMLQGMEDKLYKDKDEFEEKLEEAIEEAGLDLKKSVEGNIFKALGEKDQEAEIVTDGNGNPERDTDLTDYEYVPLGKDVREYFEEEVKPYQPHAWINEDMKDPQDDGLGKIGYEINFNRYFYEYEPPRDLGEIEEDIEEVENQIVNMIQKVTKE
ncbi:type I restriction-modification system subunit M [Candidatus Nanohalobium constans]|uniref:site-specific DNA-methyltransferase (adenine-specific) n=1 Tax=Candidatus Nanohalobium constans TaxID=2565781 RepID=A0A5Q0UH10_9ARCH|nr:class I SAM-dependent DNA methyltransferase [Candidatus Nanohalobium constans]QGA80874.1 type I restriction endonuclease subunit M [Candidatus Nanohalobium constans]